MRQGKYQSRDPVWRRPDNQYRGENEPNEIENDGYRKIVPSTIIVMKATWRGKGEELAGEEVTNLLCRRRWLWQVVVVAFR